MSSLSKNVPLYRPARRRPSSLFAVPGGPMNSMCSPASAASSSSRTCHAQDGCQRHSFLCQCQAYMACFRCRKLPGSMQAQYEKAMPTSVSLSTRPSWSTLMAASRRARRSAGPDEVGTDGAEAPLLCRTELSMLSKRDSAARCSLVTWKRDHTSCTSRICCPRSSLWATAKSCISVHATRREQKLHSTCSSCFSSLAASPEVIALLIFGRLPSLLGGV